MSSPKHVGGHSDAVPCAHCGRPNDYRELEEQHLLERGSVYSCDHCGRMNQTVKVAQVTYITVRQAPGQRPVSPPPKPPTAPAKKGLLARLTGR